MPKGKVAIVDDIKGSYIIGNKYKYNSEIYILESYQLSKNSATIYSNTDKSSCLIIGVALDILIPCPIVYPVELPLTPPVEFLATSPIIRNFVFTGEYKLGDPNCPFKVTAIPNTQKNIKIIEASPIKPSDKNSPSFSRDGDENRNNNDKIKKKDNIKVIIKVYLHFDLSFNLILSMTISFFVQRFQPKLKSNIFFFSHSFF